MLRGKMINIRPMNSEDLELFYTWMSEQEYMGDYMGAEMYYKDTYIENMKKNFSDHNTMFAVIEDKDKKPLGIINFFTHRGNSVTADIGMLLADASTRGKGIGEEALRLFTDFLFNTKTFARIQYQTRVENIAMKRIGEKVGYSVEGILRNYRFDLGRCRDYYMIAITREDWLNKTDMLR